METNFDRVAVGKYSVVHIARSHGIIRSQIRKQGIASVNKPIDPSYYANKKIEPITVIEQWGLGFHLGNAIKYIARHKEKGSSQDDLIKAANYIYRKATGRWLPKEVLDANDTIEKNQWVQVEQEIAGRDEGHSSRLEAAMRQDFRDHIHRLFDSGRFEDPGGAKAPRRQRSEQDAKKPSPSRLRRGLRRSSRRKN